MKFSVRDLQRTQQAVHLSDTKTIASLPSAGGDVPLTTPVRMQADVYASDGELLAVIDAGTEATVACSRCLGTATLPLHVRFTEVLRPSAQSDPEEADDGDRHITYFSGDEVDLVPVVVESLALALPMKPLCRTDCRGLCQVCGHDLNESDCGCTVGETDPRLAKLGELWHQARSARKGVE